jgi:PfaD family protein
MSSNAYSHQCANDIPGDDALSVHDALFQLNSPIYIPDQNSQYKVYSSSATFLDAATAENKPLSASTAYVPALLPESFGDPLFKKAHHLQYPLIAGAMANGITSTDMVEEMGRSGMIGFFGAGGLSLDQIGAAIDRLQSVMGDHPFGFNLIHSPYDMALEAATVDLYLRRGIRRVSAAAFLDLTLPLVHYRLKGIHRNNKGEVVCPNQIIAKVSRTEVARKFMSPPPPKIISALLEKNLITQEEARLASLVPVADDLTAEADSGGHTDNRPALALLRWPPPLPWVRPMY